MKQTSLKITLASAFAAAMMTLAPAAVLSFPAAASAAQMGPEELYANFTGAVKNNRGDVVKKMLAQGYRDRKSTRLNSSHPSRSRMPSSA